MEENSLIVQWVQQCLERRISSYRWALERLVIQAPDNMAADADRLIGELAAQTANPPVAARPVIGRCAERTRLNQVLRLGFDQRLVRAGFGLLGTCGSVCTLQLDAASEAWACGIRPGSGASAFSTISPVAVGELMISRSAAVTSSSSGNSCMLGFRHQIELDHLACRRSGR